MARWCTLTSLLLVSLGISGSVEAQSNQYVDPSVVPAGHAYGHAQVGGKAKLRSAGPVGPLPAGPGRTIYEQLPDDQGWLYDDMPLDRMLKNAFRHAYFRTDYLLWNISAPGNDLLGSGTDIVDLDDLSPNDGQVLTSPTPQGDPFVFQPFVNPTTPFQVSNPINNNTSYIAVVQPSLHDVRVDSNNGIRGTFGLPIANRGIVEASFFTLQTSTSPILREQTHQWDIYDSNGNLIFGEVHTGLTTGEFDRNGNGIVDERVNSFQAFATPILIDGQIPTPARVVPIPSTPGVELFRWPSVTNPLSPGTELVQTDPLDPNSLVLQEIPGRGDNFRIIWAIRDPNNPADFISTYQASLKSSLWGTESNYIMDPLDPGSPLSLQPFAGFRYMRFGEDLRQSGLYTSTAISPINGLPTEANILRVIDATTINNIYGPQVGLRSELKSRWFSVGVQPKVMLGVNTYKADLATENILSIDDVDQNLKENKSTFGVVGDLEAYTRLHVTEHLSFQVGYNLMWAGIVTRPYDNIVYNARTIQTPNPNGDGTVTNSLQSDFKLDPKFSGLLIQGLNIGGELRY